MILIEVQTTRKSNESTTFYFTVVELWNLPVLTLKYLKYHGLPILMPICLLIVERYLNIFQKHFVRIFCIVFLNIELIFCLAIQLFLFGDIINAFLSVTNTQLGQAATCFFVPSTLHTALKSNISLSGPYCYYYSLLFSACCWSFLSHYGWLAHTTFYSQSLFLEL